MKWNWGIKRLLRMDVGHDRMFLILPEEEKNLGR